MRAVLLNPVAPRESGVQDAVLHVTGHLLGADQHALDFRIVDAGVVGAAVDVDVEARAAEKIDRGVLQAAFWDSQLKHAHFLPP